MFIAGDKKKILDRKCLKKMKKKNTLFLFFSQNDQRISIVG